MKISCTDVMVPGDSLTDKAIKLNAWGFDGIGVFADYADWNEQKLDEVVQLFDRTGVAPCEFVFMGPLYGHLMDKDENIRTQSLQMYKDTLDVCKMIGAVTEMEFEYGIQDPLPLFEPYKEMSASEEAGFLEVLNQLGNHVEGSSAYVLIEPINRYETKYLTRLQDCKAVLDKVELSNAGILADFFHMAMEESDLPASIRNVDGLIKHVHLGDNNRLLPGYGNIDWAACIQALKEVGFDGYMSLECGVSGDPEIELPKAASYLKGLIE